MLENHHWIIVFTLSILALSGFARAHGATNATGELACSLFPPKRFRTPQWPLKTERVLLTDEQIQMARRACESDQDAADIRDKIVEIADYWADKSDEYLRELLPGGEVPRAFNVSAKGCPVHGTEIYKHGTYPWILDREKPFVVKCPIGGEEYPSNDFAAYRETGMKDKSLLTGDYADSGRGYVSPEGEKYWFVGYACHWNWSRNWRTAVNYLARAYVLTGDRKYARKCLVMLDRIAESYPDFDYDSQSRYSEMMGGGYEGKILNKIWETSTLNFFATAYDAVFDTLIGPDAISFEHRTSEQIRANIEANILEEGIDCVPQRLIVGNWGMHQIALASAILARQNGPTEQLLEPIFENTGKGQHIWNTGLNFMLYNLTSADGMPFETSPGYCSGWVNKLAQIADALRPSGIDLYANPKVLRMFDAFLDLTCIGVTTPSLGDSGGIGTSFNTPQAYTYRSAFRATGNPRYAWAAALLDSKGLESNYRSYFDLFLQPLASDLKAAAESHVEDVKSRLLDEYGWAALNNEPNTVGLSMYYGIKAGHGHFDRLGIDIYGHGRKLAPDLGYPDFMNAFVSGIYTWSKNTISHNTVQVDRQRQLGNVQGEVLQFHPGKKVQVIDVAAEGTYPQTSVYRRTLLQIDINDDNSYFIDLFRAAGGENHLLSVHGIPGQFSISGMTLSDPQTEGTLAGEDVPYGHIYDNTKMSSPDYKGGFTGYTGSGFQHLFNVQKGPRGESGTAQWMDDSGTGLRATILPASNQQLIIADAYVSPTQKVPDIIKYVLADRQNEESCFTTIWEPFKEKPFIKEVIQLSTPDSAHSSVALRIIFTDGREHFVAVAPQPGKMIDIGHGISSDSAVLVLEQRKQSREILLALEGTQVHYDGKSVDVPETVSAEIAQVDYRARTLSLAGEGASHNWSEGDWVRVHNDKHTGFRQITSIPGEETISLNRWDLLCAKVRVESIDEEQNTIVAESPLPWLDHILGTHVVTGNMKPVAKVIGIEGQTLLLDTVSSLAADDEGPLDIYLAAAGPGDRVESAGYLEASKTQ